MAAILSRPQWKMAAIFQTTFSNAFFNENVWTSNKISLKFVSEVSINNIPAMIQIMAWCRLGNKPLPDPMMISLPMHICVTRPQWVNGFELYFINQTHWIKWPRRYWQSLGHQLCYSWLPDQILCHHYVYVPSQWETMLHCNVVSHWLGAYTEWSLLFNKQKWELTDKLDASIWWRQETWAILLENKMGLFTQCHAGSKDGRVNSPRHGDVYMCQWTGPSLVQVMDWCLFVPSHYLNQGKLITNETLENKL